MNGKMLMAVSVEGGVVELESVRMDIWTRRKLDAWDGATECSIMRRRR